MLTASNVSTPEIAAKVRQGTQSIENVLPNTTNIASGEDVASKVKQSMQTGAAASDRVGKIKEEPVTGGEVITGNVYTPTDDLLDSTAEADAQEQANIDAFNAEPLVDNTDNSDPYGLEAQETQAKEREKGELEKSILKKEAELERKKKQGGYAAYKALRDQARQLRTQWWAGRRTLSKAQKAALEAQIKALLAQADAALKGK
jgi:hypothetical protein